MSQKNTKILCPDCMLYELKSKNEQENKRCEQCSKRYRSCTTLRTSRGLEPIEYIPIKDCEYDVYQKFFNKFKGTDTKSEKINNVEKGDDVTKRKRRATKYTDEFINYVRIISKDKTSDKILEMIHNNYSEYSDMKQKNLIDFLRNHNIEYIRRYNNPEELKKRKPPKENPALKNKIYTEEVLDEIKRLADCATSVSKMIPILNEKFEPKKFNANTLYQVMYKNKIHISKKQLLTIVTDNQLLDELDTQIKTATEVLSTPKDEVTLIQNNQEDRYAPIRAEVEATAKKKFKELKCDLEINPTTDDYISALKSIRYLCGNLNRIETNRLNQHDVMSNFDDDVTHTIENEEPLPGDTYLLDKLKVVRNIRRYYEYDMQDMVALKEFINSIDIKKLDVAIHRLETQKKNRNEAYYIPTVDMEMVDKYDWAIQGSPNADKNNKNILKTTTAKTKYTNQSRTFRATCDISGGPFGVFQKWIKDYRCNTQDDALVNAKKELASIIRQNRGGVHYINLEAHQLN